MSPIIHERNGVKVAEIRAAGVIINDAGDFLDLVANSGTRHLVIPKGSVCPEFFDLSSGVAGEILQKASNYGICFGIFGDFADVRSKSLRDFIYESNRTGKHIFVTSLEDALSVFCGEQGTRG